MVILQYFCKGLSEKIFGTAAQLGYVTEAPRHWEMVFRGLLHLRRALLARFCEARVPHVGFGVGLGIFGGWGESRKWLRGGERRCQAGPRAGAAGGRGGWVGGWGGCFAGRGGCVGGGAASPSPALH